MQRRTRATTFGALTTAVLTGLAALPALTAPASAYAPDDGAVFINEIHYDNDGTDTGEAIEVAGPAGTDLAGWSLVLYNGSDNEVYDTAALSGVLADQQDGYGTSVVDYPTNGVQNGPDDGIALVDSSGSVVQFLSYEGTLTAADGAAEGMTSTDIGVSESGATQAGESLQLTGTGLTYGHFTWATAGVGTFGEPNTDQVFAKPKPVRGGPENRPRPDTPAEPKGSPVCGVQDLTEIGEVQGSGWTTPLRGEQVTVEGVVVGDFQGEDQLSGVFIQDPDGDGDPATSDGVFVYAPGVNDVEAGDEIRVTGTAEERFGQTQISDVTEFSTCGAEEAIDVEPTVLELPADDVTRERHEGMLVTFSEPLTATETYTLARYGELVVSADGRLFQPTNGGTGDDEAEQDLNDERRLTIDDGSNVENPDEVPFSDLDFADGGDVIRLGDTLTDVVGVLSYGFSTWRLQPTADATVTRDNPRPGAPDEVGGDVQVASFNVLNYFTTIDVAGAETDGGHDPRGANSVEEFERQQAKIVAAILALDAEIVGLMEIENDADDEALLDLVAALNEAAGEDRYAAIEEPDTTEEPGQLGGIFGTDAIKVAMIYQPDAVTPVGAATTTEDEAFDNARLPLAQQFVTEEGGEPFTVVVNHFKSKGCGGATGDNRDQRDGQGCYNADRVEQAAALLDFIEGLGDEEVLIIGDLNSYGEEDPIDLIEEAGYVDLVDTTLEESDQYTYVFSGQFGYLDHALASPSMAEWVTGVDIWHINSDEAPFLDYNTEYNPEGFWDATPYRSSDHDPVLVGLAAPSAG